MSGSIVKIVLAGVALASAFIISGCAAGNPAGGSEQELVCGDGVVWIYDNIGNRPPDGYVFRGNGVFFYVIQSNGNWSADNCAFIGGTQECGYSGTWMAGGGIITFTHEDGRQARVRYTMLGNDGMLLYDNGETAPPSQLIKARVGNLYVN